MSISRTLRRSSDGPPPPNYIPDAPGAPAYIPKTPSEAQAQIRAQARMEKGFVREAVKPRVHLRELKRLNGLREYSETMVEFVKINAATEDLLHDRSGELDADVFCFLLNSSEEAALLATTGANVAQLDAFRSLLSGKAYALEDAHAFATLIHQLPNPLEKAIHDLPGFEMVRQRADALVTAGSRVRFVHSMVNTGTHRLNPAYDLGQIVKPGTPDGSGPRPAVVGVLNPASRSGWGKSGASHAIQKGAAGTGFKAVQKALYQRRTNLVGNAPVAQTHVVPLSDDRVVFSVAGPNHKHHTGLRVKLPRLSHWFKPDQASRSQESKLRAAYRTFFASVDQYNADAKLTGKETIQQLHMVPISANVFGFPKDKAARIMAEEILSYTAENPNIQVQVLAVNDPALAGHIESDFEKFGATSQTDTGVPARD
jgi:hypothetical protein